MWDILSVFFMHVLIITEKYFYGSSSIYFQNFLYSYFCNRFCEYILGRFSQHNVIYSKISLIDISQKVKFIISIM